MQTHSEPLKNLDQCVQQTDLTGGVIMTNDQNQFVPGTPQGASPTQNPQMDVVGNPPSAIHLTQPQSVQAGHNSVNQGGVPTNNHSPPQLGNQQPTNGPPGPQHVESSPEVPDTIPLRLRKVGSDKDRAAVLDETLKYMTSEDQGRLTHISEAIATEAEALSQSFDQARNTNRVTRQMKSTCGKRLRYRLDQLDIKIGLFWDALPAYVDGQPEAGTIYENFGLLPSGKRSKDRTQRGQLLSAETIIATADALVAAEKEEPLPKMLTQIRAHYAVAQREFDLCQAALAKKADALAVLKESRLAVDDFLRRLRGYVKTLAAGDRSWERATMRALGFRYIPKRQRKPADNPS